MTSIAALNHSGWKGCREVSGPISCLKEGQMWDCARSSWESWGVKTAQPLSAICSASWLSSVGEKLFLTSIRNFLFQLMSFVSCPPAMVCCGKPTSIFSTPPPMGYWRMQLTALEAICSRLKKPQPCSCCCRWSPTISVPRSELCPVCQHLVQTSHNQTQDFWWGLMNAKKGLINPALNLLPVMPAV